MSVLFQVEFDLMKRSGELKTYECEKWSAKKKESLLRWILKNKNKDPLRKFLIDASSTTPEGKNREYLEIFCSQQRYYTQQGWQ